MRPHRRGIVLFNFLPNRAAVPSIRPRYPDYHHVTVGLERILLAFPCRTFGIGARNVCCDQRVPAATGRGNTRLERSDGVHRPWYRSNLSFTRTFRAEG